jgi:hypothetical protein
MNARAHRLVRLTRIAIAAAAVCVLSVNVGSALAQGGDGGGRRGGGPGGGFGGMFGRGGFEPSITSRDMDRFGQILAFDAEQKEVVNTLLEAYQQNFTTAAKAIRDKMEAVREEFRETQDPSVWESFGTEMQKFRSKSQEMETGLFNDIKAVLTPQQAEQWPHIERTHRRERTIGRGLMSGERVDVIRIIDDLKLTDEQKAPLATVLDQYETDLDRELVTRNAVQEEAIGQFQQMFRGGGDQDAIQKLWDRGREASMRVRDVNNRYARQVEPMLPEDKRAEFAAQVQRESFPMIYRPSYATRIVDTAAGFEDLDENQKAAIATIKESFGRQLDSINKQMEDAWKKREESITPQDMMRGFGRGGGGDDQTETLRDQRRTLETETIDKVRALLTPEQAAKLPERDARGGGQGGPGGRDGEDGAPRRRNRDGGDQPPRRPRPGDSAPPDSRI